MVAAGDTVAGFQHGDGFPGRDQGAGSAEPG
jgi:hypothetical protein